ERPDTPNRLNRDFAVQHPNQVSCGDITNAWTQARWHYLATVLDLHTRRVVDWTFSANRMPSWQSKPSIWPTSSAASHSRCVPFGSGQPVRQPLVPAAAMALPDATEHELPRKLRGQFAAGAPVLQLKVREDSGS